MTAAVSAGLISVILWRCAPFHGLDPRDDPVFMIFGLPLLAIFVGSMVCLIVMESGSHHPVWWTLRSWPMRTIGVVSYTLYLNHLLVYMLIRRVIHPLALCAFVSLGVALILSWLSWRFIESPILAKD
ncbi:MAG: hypothetical protein WA485_03220 [Candidatus Sulfotelmatobacter sp.]